ncbi:unnamed protein product [Nezara viridula]|uniref:Uncharacterized protein n=1 Tax=Nezara viridula TaxID=85310 RepID=A0A9P0MJX9_NEZVI|nr:unnamed protein product [Nezara viridula]
MQRGLQRWPMSSLRWHSSIFFLYSFFRSPKSFYRGYLGGTSSRPLSIQIVCRRCILTPSLVKSQLVRSSEFDE